MMSFGQINVSDSEIFWRPTNQPFCFYVSELGFQERNFCYYYIILVLYIHTETYLINVMFCKWI